MPTDESDFSERGPKAPVTSLPEALELLKLVRDRIGFAEASRETVAEALGHTSLNGTSKRKIAALSHFDLISRSGGGAYRISDLGRRILMPTDSGEHSQAIAEAAMRPSMYAKLFARYDGHVLPLMLPNVLAREFKVLPQSSEQVAQNFRESAEFAGLLRNGILSSQPELTQLTGDASPVPKITADRSDDMNLASDSSARPRIQISAADERTKAFVLPLDNQGRIAEVVLPLPLSSRDIRKLKAWVDYMSSVVEETPGEISAN